MDSLLLAGALVATSFLGSAAVVYVVRAFARSRRLLDVPNDRSAHVSPTPRLGGIGIVAAFAVTSALWIALAGDGRVGTVLVAVCFMSLVGVVDDVRPLSARVRFLLQAAAATLVVVSRRDALDGLVQLAALPWWIVAPIAIVWIIWMTNLYNFMDGIDGLAAGQAVLASAGLAVAAAVVGAVDAAVLLALLAAASAGFLIFNFPPASIFMGDVGSTAIGFFFGCVPFIRGRGSLPVEIVWIALGLFVLDATTTLLRRMAAGERWFAAHRTHWYQRPLRAGVTHRTITSTAYVAMAAVAVAAAAYAFAPHPGRTVLLGLPVVLFAILAAAVRRAEAGIRSALDERLAARAEGANASE